MKATEDAMERVVEERRLTGVRGLLLIPPILAAMYMLVLTIGLMRVLLAGPIETIEGAGLAVLSGVLIAIGAFAIWTLLLEKRIARRLMLIFFSVSGLLNLFSLVGELAMPGAAPLDLIASARGIVLAVAMVAYFLRSMRVKLTLIN